MRRTVFSCLLAVLAVFLAGCQIKPQQLRPALTRDGELYVYMEPLPQRAYRLGFELADVYAVRADGAAVPLELHASRFSGGTASRQRLAAAGVLPAGRYSGLSFRIKEASLGDYGQKAAMLAPDKPVFRAFRFSAVAKEAVVLTLSLRYGEAVKGSFSFTPAFDLAIPSIPVGSLAGYVVNSRSNDITVFNKLTMEASGVIPTGAGPSAMALSLQAGRGYVALPLEDAVDVIDTTQDRIIGRIRMTTGDRPLALALTPDGSALLVANSGSNTVSIINPVSYVETARIKVGMRPVSIELDSQGQRAYVLNSFSNTISVIDIASGSVLANVPAGFAPLRGAFNALGDRFYLIDRDSPWLLSMDTQTMTVIDRQMAGPGMDALEVDRKTGLIYISMKDSPYVEIFSPFAPLPVGRIKAATGLDYMAIDYDGNDLCALDRGRDELIFIDLARGKVESVMDVGQGPRRIALAGGQ